MQYVPPHRLRAEGDDLALAQGRLGLAGPALGRGDRHLVPEVTRDPVRCVG